ncbi:RNA methyltransferase [Microlunatus elymi]|uniref:RNA methyltransferase n=1 Tax=Microlunatus elymi TaxID=2596828 RepID=A0A516PY99_9ACTN|nr:RNA methyltransferase [Microlunatus elymi]QDP96143.1 RNA methyltransferase [Microlunatus elymi]
MPASVARPGEPQRAQQIGVSHAEVRHGLAVRRGHVPGRLLIDGVWAHQAAIDAGAHFETVFLVPELLHTTEAALLAEQCTDYADQCYRLSSKIIQRFSDRDRSDGLASIIEVPRWRPDGLRLGPDALIVVADGLQSPGNIGTVIRTMDACRGDLLIMTNVRARPDGDQVFRGSRGLSLTLPQLIIQTPEQVIGWLGDRAVSIMVADANGGVPYPRSDLRGPTAIVLGNERYGASDSWRDFPRVQVPMLGRADSLNVAVSAGVLLYHARSQRERW